MDNTAENRMQSYRDFLRRKTEKQRLYRAKLKAEAQVLGIPKRKYVRRTTKVQGISKCPEVKRTKYIMKIEKNTIYSDTDEGYDYLPSDMNSYLVETETEEDTSGQRFVCLRETTDEVPEVINEEAEEEETTGEVTEQKEQEVEFVSEAEEHDLLQTEEVVEPTVEQPSIQVREEPLEYQIFEEDPVVPAKLTDEEEQEAFYSKRDIILRLMDKLSKEDRLHHLTEVEMLLRTAVNNQTGKT